MRLELGQVDDVAFVAATADGWQLSPASGPGVALGSREGWPSEALRSPAGMTAALQAETLVELGIAEPLNDELIVPWDRFDQVLQEEFELPVRWTKACPLLLTIESTSSIGRTDFEYRYSFRLGAHETAIDRVGYFVRRRATGQTYYLDPQTYAVVDAMDRFNALPGEERKAQGWLTFSTVKGCATTIGARLDSYLSSNDVVVPSQLSLDLFNHEDGSLSFVPRCPEISDSELREAFLRNTDVPGFYSLDALDGRRVRVVLGERHRRVLERMQSARRLKGEAKRKAEAHPEMYFDGVRDDVEITYGARVTGVGEFPFVADPREHRAGVGFFDGVGLVAERELAETKRRIERPVEIRLDGQHGDVRLQFSDQRELAEARSAMAQALSDGQQTVVLAGQTVSVSEQALAALQHEPVDQQSGGTNRASRRFLLVYTNETETVARDVEAARQASSSRQWTEELELPQALMPDTPLKPHQRDGLLWLQRCRELRPGRRGVLLADDMGLGKTVQILTHLARAIEQGSLRSSHRQSGNSAPWRPILIVAPLLLVESETWRNEMRRFFRHDGDIFEPVLVLHGPGIDRVRAGRGRGQENIVGKPLLDADKLMQYRTVITNYDTVVRYQHSFAQLKNGRSLWSALVTDEAQGYKTPNSKRSHALKAIECDFHIASTGTPVENRLLDLWNIMDTIQPALLGTKAEFCETFERPLGTEAAAEALADLRRRLLFGEPHTFITRRTKDQVLDLPAKEIVPLYCEMSAAERVQHQELLGALVEQRRAGRHLAVLHRLTDLYQHPSLLRGDSGSATAETLLSESGKLRAVADRLREIRRAGEKAIIFARRHEMQQILSRVIEHEFKISVPIINGVTSKTDQYEGSSASSSRARDYRKRVLADFSERPGFGVLILSPHVAGIGLTITAANHVFHYGRWWNPAVESQATDRAYRLGQQRPVFVYLPILRDSTGVIAKTFDERLNDLMERKTAVARDFLHPSDDEARNEKELCDALESDATGSAATGDRSVPFDADALARLDPHDFEAAIGALHQAEGYNVVLTTKGNDGGADVLAIRGGDLLLIQVKHTRLGGSFDQRALLDVQGACDTYSQRLAGRWKAVIVSNGPAQPAVVKEARNLGVALVTGKELIARLRDRKVGGRAMAACAATRCTTFEDGVRQARQYLQPTTSS